MAICIQKLWNHIEFLTSDKKDRLPPVQTARWTTHCYCGRAHCLGMSYYFNFLEGLGSNKFNIKWRFGTHDSWKNQNPGSRLGATS